MPQQASRVALVRQLQIPTVSEGLPLRRAGWLEDAPDTQPTPAGWRGRTEDVLHAHLRPTAAANGPASAKSDGATSTAARAAAATAAFARPCRPECQSGLTRLSAPAKGTPPTGRATMGRARCCPKEPSRCPRSRARCASSVIRFRVCRLCIMSFCHSSSNGRATVRPVQRPVAGDSAADVRLTLSLRTADGNTHSLFDQLDQSGDDHLDGEEMHRILSGAAYKVGVRAARWRGLLGLRLRCCGGCGAGLQPADDTAACAAASCPHCGCCGHGGCGCCLIIESAVQIG